MTRKEAKLKLANYCAYQERSQKEVRNKLYETGLCKDEIEEIISELISENFLNEERFAKAFIGGKFRIKKWGKNKILMAIRQYDISDYCIKKGLQEIDSDDYINTLEQIITAKNDNLTENNVFVKRNKLAKYAMSKGYEAELVWDFLKQHIDK
ncbi:RecX family transcriptional regulator [Reichenbachiella sp. MALMAid0571]|uniref:regulatory protein RecX n=1 Tax=Reichenbachiella sp. MALMAid0571 TaxID=3143939 RepID=UPI0032DF17DF